MLGCPAGTGAGASILTHGAAAVKRIERDILGELQQAARASRAEAGGTAALRSVPNGQGVFLVLYCLVYCGCVERVRGISASACHG